MKIIIQISLMSLQKVIQQYMDSSDAKIFS